MPSPRHGKTPPTFKKALPAVAFVAFMFWLAYMCRAILGPMLPYIEDTFGISHSESASLLFFIAAGNALSTLLSGVTCSVVRPRTLVAGSLVASGAILLLIAETEIFPILRLLFFTVGITGGHYFNGGMSTMRSLVRQEDWSKAIAVHELGPNISFVIAPFFAVMGSAFFGWRTVSLAMGYSCLAGGAVFFFFGKGGYQTTPPVSLLGVKNAARSKHMWIFAWLLALGIAGEFAPYSVLSLYIGTELNYPGTTVAWLMSLSRVLPPFAVLYGGWIVARYGTLKTLKLCLIIYAAGLFLMATPWFIPLTVGMCAQPLATAMAFPAIFTYLTDYFSFQDQPLLLALTLPIGTLIGSGTVPALFGYCGDFAGFGLGFAVLGILAVATIFLLPSAK